MARNCGSVQNYFRQVDLFPDLRRNQAILQQRTRARVAGAAEFPRRIPVVVNIMFNDEADNVTDDQVASQIEVLNEDFAGRNTDLANVPEPFAQLVGVPELEFFIADVDPDGGPTTGINRRPTHITEFAIDDTMKTDAGGGIQAWDTSRYLNIWVCRLSGGVLGYAQFPGGAPDTDGVVILSSAFGRGGSASAPFDLGRTTTHEVGHYLNLSHIWGEERVPTCDDTDFVDDTPTQLGPNFNKPRFPTQSCPTSPDGDMFMNYMDYVDDDAMYMFTKEQVLRMHAALEFSRMQLGSGFGAAVRA
jgi:hypothetical protein